MPRWYVESGGGQYRREGITGNIIKCKNYAEFKEKYLQTLQDGDIINDINDNSNAVCKWYNDKCKQIHSFIDQSAPLEERAKELMEDYPMKSFEEIYEHKIKVKGLSHEQALEDIIKTAEKNKRKV